MSLKAKASIAYNTLMSMGGTVTLIERVKVLDCRSVLPKPEAWDEDTYEARLGDRTALSGSMTGAAYHLLCDELF